MVDSTEVVFRVLVVPNVKPLVRTCQLIEEIDEQLGRRLAIEGEDDVALGAARRQDSLTAKGVRSHSVTVSGRPRGVRPL